MPRPPRILLPKTVVMITSRVQQGLPFTHTPMMELIIWSALGAAHSLHPIKIIAFVVMGNHIHLIALVEDPVQIESFMERFKCETAHAINRCLGRRQVTVWCEGYDSPTILTLEDLIEKMAYLYINPVKACLVESVDAYPGVSSWPMFKTNRPTRVVKRIRRTFLGPIPAGDLSNSRHRELATEVAMKATQNILFRLTPNAWMEAFKGQMTEADFRKKVFLRVEEQELALECARIKDGTSAPSKDEKSTKSMDMSYLPKKFGRRMWCICSDIPLRVAFIAFIKTLRKQAREVRNEWIVGYFHQKFPPGLFPPTMPNLANLLPDYVNRCLAT